MLTNVTICHRILFQISQPPPRSFTGLVQEGMAHAERIIKSVMLPIGSAGSSRVAATASAAAPVVTSSVPVSTNPFDPPPPPTSGQSSGQSSKEEQQTTGSFVMGPIDTKAAANFVASFLQLVPKADVSIMQKVLDMKVRILVFPIFFLFKV